MSVFKSNIVGTCSSAKNDTISGCISSTSPLGIFNFTLQKALIAANPLLCGQRDATLQWERTVSQDFINCCGNNRMDFSFFEDMFAGSKKEVKTKDYFQRYRGNDDQNVETATAGLMAAGVTQKFQLARGSHNSTGTSSRIQPGFMLINTRSKQVLKIDSINTTTPYSFLVTVSNTKVGVNVSILANDKFLVVPAVAVNGASCPVGATEINSNFTSKKMNRLRLRTEWCMKMEADRPYADHMKFASFVDKNGNIHEQVLPTLKINAMLQVTQAVNTMLFMGGGIEANTSVDDFTGGESLIGAIEGAGNVYDYDVTKGFSLISDMKQIILNEELKKRTMEWMIKGSLNFLVTMTDKTTADTRNEITPLNFGSIERFGATQEGIRKHSVKTFEVYNRKIMFEEWGELNKSNSIGNGRMPDLGIMLSMDGLTDSNNNAVPPVQFFNVPGWDEMLENDRNQWLIAGCEELKGDVIATKFWIVNCPDAHTLINPLYC